MNNEDYRKKIEEKYKKEFDLIMNQNNAAPFENNETNNDELFFISEDEDEDEIIFISDDEMDIFPEEEEFDLDDFDFDSENTEFDFDNFDSFSDDNDFDFENSDFLSEDDEFDYDDIELLPDEELDLDYYELLDEDEKWEYDNLFIDHHKLYSEKKALQNERESIVNEIMEKYAGSGIKIYTNKEKSLITIEGHSFDPTDRIAIEKQIQQQLNKREEARVRTEKAINGLKNSIARRNSIRVVRYRNAGGEYTEYILENDDRIVMHLKEIQRAMGAVRKGRTKVIVKSKKNNYYQVIDVSDHQISSFYLIP